MQDEMTLKYNSENKTYPEIHMQFISPPHTL